MSRQSVSKLAALFVCITFASTALADIPHLAKYGSTMQLIVNNRPMLLLAGELGNSSASDPKYMAVHWASLRSMHLNTVLAPVYWELIEPAEDQYDWSSVDALIKAARAHDLKLVFLWFGTWKNSMSTYVPSWVKRNEDRFPRAQLPNGLGEDILSAFAATTRNADAKAFAALMKHIKQTDGQLNTVLMVQVENEIGMLPVAREYGAEVDSLFATEQVPSVLIDRLMNPVAAPETGLHRLWEEHGAKRSGTWTAVFGEGDASAEAFQAWHYAEYANAIAAAGKAQYPLPMYVNVALNRPGKKPGEYPSGGPLPHLLDVWKVAAPAIDLLAPDIYFPNFVDLASTYKRPDNALFIPEANGANNPEVPANAFYAFGKRGAIGFGPFSIESIEDKQPNPLAEAYSVLEQLSPTILANQGMGRMSGFEPRVLFDGTVIDMPVTETIGNYKFTVTFIDPFIPKADQSPATHGGMIIQVGAEEYLIAGQGITVTLAPVGDGPPLAGIDVDYEGSFDSQGEWIKGRRLNGDQTHQGRHIRLEPGKFQIQRVTLYRYR